jgi:hypothetical protein
VNEHLTEKLLCLSQKLYGLLLAAYPADFRREYGREMARVFRDLCREKARSRKGSGLVDVWLHTFLDLACTAPKERVQRFRREFDLMRVLRTFTLAILVYAGVLLIFGRLLVSGKPYLPYAVGALFDSLISIGIAFNFLVLILVNTRLLNPVKAVRGACFAVVLLLLTFLALIPSEARPGGVAATMLVLSLLFWFGAHEVWARCQPEPTLS